MRNMGHQSLVRNLSVFPDQVPSPVAGEGEGKGPNGEGIERLLCSSSGSLRALRGDLRLPDSFAPPRLENTRYPQE